MTDTEKILQAIKNQRWYFFENNDKILFDRDSGLIWANLNCFPYIKNNFPYTCWDSYMEVKILIQNTNEERWGGFSDWRIPTVEELWKLVSDQSFPFREGKNYRIKDRFGWCVVVRNNEYAVKDLDIIDEWQGIYETSSCVLPCSSALVPQQLNPQGILDIFTTNKLIPKFDDAETNALYRKLFIDKPNTPAIPTKPARVTTANFDYRPLLEKFDTAAVDKSPIKYFDAVLAVTDVLLDALQKYETAQAETIAECLKVALNLNDKYVDSPKLTPKENILLAERQQFLATRLELGTDEPKRKILNVKEQANSFFARLDKISGDNNSIRALAELQAEPRADFEFLVESLARIILDAQRKVDFFVGHKDFVAAVAKAQTEWSDDYKAFKTSLREELAAACRNESIDDEIFSAWYDDWQVKRFAIEQRFLPLIEFVLKGNFSDAVPQTLDILRNYRDAVDKLYLNERKNIYQKFAFQAGGDLQEKFETENALYKLAEKFQRDLQKIIFAREKTEERVFLVRWSEPLLHLPIDELNNFIRDRELDAIAEEVLNRFAELRRQNYEQYLADSKSFAEAAQQRENEFNALIFRMRKDLHNQ